MLSLKLAKQLCHARLCTFSGGYKPSQSSGGSLSKGLVCRVHRSCCLGLFSPHQTTNCFWMQVTLQLESDSSPNQATHDPWVGGLMWGEEWQWFAISRNTLQSYISGAVPRSWPGLCQRIIFTQHYAAGTSLKVALHHGMLHSLDDVTGFYTSSTQR